MRAKPDLKQRVLVKVQVSRLVSSQQNQKPQPKTLSNVLQSLAVKVAQAGIEQANRFHVLDLSHVNIAALID
jgi:hypothetical protein